MRADQEHKHQIVIVWILASVILLFLWACAGCQTTRGVAADFGRLCRDVQQQIPPKDSQ